MPINVDEFGFLTQRYKGKTMPAYKGGPDIFGAAKFVAGLRMFEDKKIKQVSFWQNNFHFFSHPANKVKQQNITLLICMMIFTA